MSSPQLQVHVTLGSRFEDIDLVDLVSEAFFRHVGYVGEEADKVSLAVRESVANAIQHGNALDPGKKVEIVFGIEGRAMTLQVTDEGEGFDPEQVPDPLAPENLLKPTGRGILLMRQFVDSVDFSFNERGGTIVSMRKLLSEAALPVPGPDGPGEEAGLEEEGR